MLELRCVRNLGEKRLPLVIAALEKHGIVLKSEPDFGYDEDDIRRLGLSDRVCNALRRAGIVRVSDIKDVGQSYETKRRIMCARGIGEKGFQEILSKINSVCITE